MKKYWVAISLLSIVQTGLACSFQQTQPNVEVRINNKCDENLKIQINSYTSLFDNTQESPTKPKFDSIERNSMKIVSSSIPLVNKAGAHLEVINLKNGASCHINQLPSSLVNVEAELVGDTCSFKCSP